MQNTIKSKPKNKLKQFIATLVIFMMTFASVNFGVFTNSAFADENNYLSKVNDAINGISNKMLSRDLGDWEVLDLNKAGYTIPKQAKERINNDITKGAGKYSDTDCERMTLAALAAGLNPEGINGINLVEKIYNSKNMTAINSQVFGLLALNAGDFKVPEEAKFSKNDLKKLVLDNRTPNKKGWTFFGENPDPDMTGMAISSLAPYYSTDEDVTDAVDNALNCLKEMQTENAGFISWGNENSNSLAMVIIALCDLGKDPTDPANGFVKGSNDPIKALLTYLTTTGDGFKYRLQDEADEENPMATEQGLRALVAYRNFKEKKGSVYNFKAKAEEPKTEQLTLSVTGPKGIIVGNQKVSFKSNENLKEVITNVMKDRNIDLSIDNKAISQVDQFKNNSRKSAKWIILVNNQIVGEVSKCSLKENDKVEILFGKEENGKIIVYKDAEKINLSENEITLKIGETTQLKATVFPEDASNKDILWETSDKNIVEVNEKDGTIKAIGKGLAKITAYNKVRKEVITETICNVTVLGENETKSENTASLSILGYKGQILNIKDAKFTSGQTVEEFFEKVCNDNNIKFINKGGYIASIDGQGEFDRGVYSGWKYRVNGVFPNVGVSGVKVQNKDQIDFVYVASYMDTEAYRDAESIELNKTSLQLNAGEKAQLVATVLPNEATNKVALWKSSDESIAKVDANGNITAIKAGNVTITAYNQVAGEEPLKEVNCNVVIK